MEKQKLQQCRTKLKGLEETHLLQQFDICVFFFFKYCYFYSLSLKQNYKEERGKRKKKSTEYIEKLSDKKREIDLDQSDPAPRRHENLTQQYF